MAAPSSIRPTIMDPLLNYRFLVSWGPSTGGNLTVVAGVSKVSSLSRTTEKVEYREGGASQHTRLIPGQTKYGEINLERGIILDIAFEQWANQLWYYQNSGALGQLVSLANYRKTIEIDLCNQAGQIMMSYFIFNAWPSKYQSMPDLNAQDGATVALETLTLQNEGWVVTYAVQDTSGYPTVANDTAPVIAGVTPPS
ncbi:MAG TPA: phage tail protein [Thermoanaerobaculia bacterium]